MLCYKINLNAVSVKIEGGREVVEYAGDADGAEFLYQKMLHPYTSYPYIPLYQPSLTIPEVWNNCPASSLKVDNLL